MYKFVGIGAQKAGTTWLYEMLSQHPDISFPLGKEVHYWNRAFPAQSVEDYLAKFQHPTLSEGEITPAYAFLPTATIEEIHKYQPDLKIIFIIRNPVDRAWSSAKMALGRAEMEYHEASDAWFIDHFNSRGSLVRGDYEACLRKWRAVYDAEQLLVLKFDDLKHAPEEILSRCCHHVGIKEFNMAQLNLMHTKQAVFSTSEQALNHTLKKHLLNLYQLKINKLEDYLSIDLSEWKV